MKRALLPTDFSKKAHNSAIYALSYLHEIGTPCNVSLLNTYLVPKSTLENVVYLNDQQKRSSLMNLENELKRIEAEYKKNGHSFEVLSYMGSLNNVVRHISKEKRIDYVFLGVDSESADNQKILEDLSHNIMNTTCALLIVPSQAHFKGLKRIIFVSDTNKKNCANCLIHMGEMFHKTASHIFIAQTEKHDPIDIPRCEHHAKNHAFEFSIHHFHEQHLFNQLSYFSVEKSADLIAFCGSPEYFLDLISQQATITSILARTPFLFLNRTCKI